MKRVTGLTSHLQQRINIFFCVKLGWNSSQIKDALATVYPDPLRPAAVYYWIKEFQGGRTSVVDKPRAPKARSGRSRQNIRRVEDLVTQDRRVSIAAISARSGISEGSVQRILKHDLKLVKKSAKFVPVELTQEQKNRRAEMCTFWSRLHRNNARVFRNVVIVNESWMYVYDPETKQQSMEWLRVGEQRPQKVRRGIGTGKVMLVSFFDSRGMVYYEFVQRPLTMNQQVWRAIFTRFHHAHLRRRPHQTVHGRRFIHMDNAPAHNAFLSLALVRGLGWTRLLHPAYSPDLAPNDFWLYPFLKAPLRGKRFANLAQLKEVVADRIGQIPSQEYKTCMLQKWPRRWAQCLEYQGGYFEGLLSQI